MNRNRAISSSAISKAVSGASAGTALCPSCPLSRDEFPRLSPCSAPPGDYSNAIETLLTAIAVIKQSRVASDERCRVLLSSLKDCLHGIEAKSYSSSSSSSSRYPPPDPENGILPAGERLEGHPLGFACSFFPKEKAPIPGTLSQPVPREQPAAPGSAPQRRSARGLFPGAQPGARAASGQGQRQGPAPLRQVGMGGSAMPCEREGPRKAAPNVPLLSSLPAGI